MSATRLIVQGDDFGMCHAVNEGIVRAFDEGVLTQASTMAPCPWIEEAAAEARQREIPIGVHSTLTSEWDHLRWRPITAGASLAESDGSMHRTLEGAMRSVDAADGAAELRAQTERLIELGLAPRYLDCHMGPTSIEAFGEACRAFELPFLYPLVPEAMKLDSIAMLSPMPSDEKKPWLLDRLENLTPGLHLIVAHPGTPGPELRSLAHPNAENRIWAEEYRASDLEVLLDPEVKDRIEALGIELVAVGDI
jgi:hypothetical protein